jgi:PASTA domain
MGVPVYYLPWWVLLACLLASALAAYLALRDSALSRRALFVLTVVLAPLVLLGATVAALALSVSLPILAQDVPDALKGALEEPSEEARQERPGPEEIEVPDVEGLTQREARNRLQRDGFAVGVRHREGSEEEAGMVLGQSVPGAKEAQKGSKILLTVGEGARVARIPNLVGLSYTEAENKLEGSGFLLGGVQEAPSATVPAGVIMKQDPPAGTPLEPNSYVYLTTSVGPSP